ncbi:MAG: ion transporter, partial [Pseudomonadota bacterium]
MIGTLERFFNRSFTKFVLAFLIIISVLPLPEIRKFDLVFFAIFGVELVVRLILFARLKERRRLFEAFMLIIDTVAVLSFLPIPHQVVQTRYLRLVRLFRLSLLLRFAASLARDMWNIVARKEIKYQLGFLLGAVAILTFLSGIVLHALQVPIDLDNDGGVEIGSLKDVLWWSFREIESQDNITQNLNGPFVFIVFSFVLTLAGVFVMSLLIGVGSSVVEELLTASKEKPVALFDHTVVIGRGRNLLYLLTVLVRIMKKNRERPAIALLSDSGDPPHFLYEHELRKVEYRTGDPSELRSLQLVNAGDAGKVLIIYDDEKEQLADAYSISTVLAVRDRSTCPIFLELRHDESIQAARDAATGGDITPIPMGKFLGTILCQNVIFPGMDRIFEELLTSRGSEIYTTFFSEKEK